MSAEYLLYLLLLAASWSSCASLSWSSFQDFDLKYDTNKDWISGIVAKGPEGCTIPPKAPNGPAPKCGTQRKSNLTVAQMRSLGWQLAPKLYMHPDENSRLTDPSKWLMQKPIYNPLDYSQVDITDSNATATAMSLLTVLGSPFFTSHVFQGFAPGADIANVTNADLQQIIQGDPVDAKGYSTAQLFYTAIDAADDLALQANYSRGEIIQFTFHYFYPWNGCSNQLFAMNMDAKYQGIEYYMCPAGVHEGDWERLSMWVCVNDWDEADPSQAIKRVQYSAHEWNAQYECSKGQCTFEVDEQGRRRLVAYAGLFSHAMYPEASPLQLYQKASAAWLLNIDGVYIGDRTAKGAVFLPSSDNTHLLPLPQEMSADQKTGEYAWAMYAGSWGGAIADTPDQTSITCFSNNFTLEGPCPKLNPATAFLKTALDVKSNVVPEGQLNWWCNIDTKKVAQVNAVTGPLMRAYTYAWQPASEPPIYERTGGIITTGGDISCPFSGDPTSTAHGGFQSYDPYDYASLLGSVIALLLGAGLVFGLALYFPRLHSVDQLRELLAATRIKDVRQAKKATRMVTYKYVATRPLVWLLIGLATYVVGMVLAVVGIKDTFTAMERIYKTSLYDTVQHVFIAVLLVFFGWEIIVVIFVVLLRGQQLVQFISVTIPNPLRHWKAAYRAGWIVQSIVACLQVVAINTTMLLFAFGFVVMLLRILTQTVCASVLTRLFDATPAASICLDLSTFGIDKTLCGSDLTSTCNIWYGLHVSYVMYGALLLALSHVLYLSMAVHQFVSLHEMQAVSDVLDTEDFMATLTTAGSGDIRSELSAHLRSELSGPHSRREPSALRLHVRRSSMSTILGPGLITTTFDLHSNSDRH